jgi:hypothetical protein
MSSAIDVEETKRRYAHSEDAELVRITFVNPDDFVDEAVELAKEELARRGIEGQDHPLAKEAEKKLRLQNAEEAVVASLPANKFLLAVCFVFADLVAIIAALMYHSNGRKRASKQVWKAFGLGWVLRLVLIAVFKFS